MTFPGGLWVHLWRGRRAAGQGMVEYGIVLVLVAVVVVIALFAIGPKVASMYVTGGASLSSDRTKKASRVAVDARAVLAQAVALPIMART